MKKLILSMAFSVSFIFSFSQVSSVVDWSPSLYSVGKKYPGYVVSLSGDTIKGYIKAGKRCPVAGLGKSNQNYVEFYKNEKDKKASNKYKPENLKGYMVAGKVYESIEYSGGLTKKANFNLVIKDGAIKQYEWYSTKENYATVRRSSGESYKDYDARRFNTKLIIAKEPSNPIEYSSLGLSFAKKMPKMIADYPELATKVKNKEKGYKWINFFDVIDEYNTWAASK